MHWPVFSEKLHITIPIRLACHQDRDTTVGRLSLIHLENNALVNEVYVKSISCLRKESFPLLPFVLKVMSYLFWPVESLKPKVLADTFATGLLQLRRDKESLSVGSFTSDREG